MNAYANPYYYFENENNKDNKKTYIPFILMPMPAGYELETILYNMLEKVSKGYNVPIQDLKAEIVLEYSELNNTWLLSSQIVYDGDIKNIK